MDAVRRSLSFKLSLTVPPDVLSEYQEVTAIHIYSLAPHQNCDRSLLTDTAKSISEYPREKDPATAAKKFGIILNPTLRKRDRGGRPVTSALTAQKPAKAEPVQKPAPTNSSTPKPAPAPPAKLKSEPSDTASKIPTPSSSSSKSAGPTSKRGGPGGIMQSFAKAASKPPSKPKPAPEKEDDAAMALSDDGEADDADMPTAKETSADATTTRRTRKEREDELRRMMEEDEDEEKDENSEQSDEEMHDAVEPEPEAVAEPQAEEKSEDKEPAEVVSSTGDGRRRGKRRIMKKKRILDDQGYMGRYLGSVFVFQTSSLTYHRSDDSRTWLGILFGGRGGSTAGKESYPYTHPVILESKGEKAYRKKRAGQHHVILLQKVAKN